VTTTMGAPRPEAPEGLRVLVFELLRCATIGELAEIAAISGFSLSYLRQLLNGANRTGKRRIKLTRTTAVALLYAFERRTSDNPPVDLYPGEMEATRKAGLLARVLRYLPLPRRR